MNTTTRKKLVAREAEVVSEQPQQGVQVINSDTSVEFFISKGIENNLPVETMERLFALRNEFIKQEAKKAFDTSMSNFQGECPTIVKTKSVYTKSGTKAYSYAPIESIVEQVQPLLKGNKLSFSFKIEIGDQKVKAICIVKHIDGHTESSEMEVPLGSKTDIMSNSQVTAAASTFAKRYAFCNAFGIMTGDEDTDGKEFDTKTDKKKQPISIKAQITFLLKELGIDTEQDKEVVREEIKRLTQVEVSVEESDLQEIKNRLELLLAEKREHA